MKKDKRYRVEVEWTDGMVTVAWYDNFDDMDDRLDYLRSNCSHEYSTIVVTDTATKRRMNEFYEVI